MANLGNDDTSMAKKKQEDAFNLENILFKCRDILRQARNSGSFFEKRDMMLTLIFLRFIGEKFEDGIEKLRQQLIADGLDPDDPEIQAAFFDDATFTDGMYFLPVSNVHTPSLLPHIQSPTTPPAQVRSHFDSQCIAKRVWTCLQIQ